jgi:hypothetical protein
VGNLIPDEAHDLGAPLDQRLGEPGAEQAAATGYQDVAAAPELFVWIHVYSSAGDQQRQL